MIRSPLAGAPGSGERSHRADALLVRLIGMASERIPAGDGLRLRFMPDDATLHRVTEIILAERQCFSQLRFTLELEPNHGPAWLTIGGPPGTGDFLSGLLQDRDDTPGGPVSEMN